MFDILFVLLIAPFVLPLIAVLALLVRLDGGPAFYSQVRVGRGGRKFRMLKLRTMVRDADSRLAQHLAQNPQAAAEWAQKQKLVDDPRITPLGRVLRRTSLDELPQILNVLRGNMSVVGPRPFTAEQEAEYRQCGGALYFAMRPGLTGPWQVSDRHGSRFVDRKLFDDHYVRTLSLGNDLRYVLLTVVAMIACTGR
ncbi:bacterial sugar transferase [Oceanicola granulosus HTCC2516]|uniref:Bacterial sugar transferase n=1 Tax=Oceanicola granulosus (strain ATCC BAA-861 / DSM 15982 / KCTC 12143 / HTCC2516) TaxID=314256 RepID=Q2CES3_OCEGH|nr:sugar transferase [Oceanicola granulosus]EAR51185.1 bacterial sugar transferase [Oceanicola granulosus HTCC2516]